MTPPTVEEFNHQIVGDAKERPAGHETIPYAEGLPDPYKKYVDEKGGTR